MKTLEVIKNKAILTSSNTGIHTYNNYNTHNGFNITFETSIFF